MEQELTQCLEEPMTIDLLLLWPTAKVAVMGPQQIAGVMSIVRRRARAARTGEKI